MFIAIKGENFDGHDFAAKAIESGAKAVICEKDCGLGESQILVESTRQALLDLAGYYRSLFNIPVIGITLPFLSTGGTSMIMMYVSIGPVLSIPTHREKKRHMFYEEKD